MGAIYDATVQFFKEEEWVYIEIEGKPVLSLNYAGKVGRGLALRRRKKTRI